MKEITIGFSPCPNDTFIFDALINNRIDTKGYRFIPVLADVEELNKLASEKKLDVTKLSVGAYPSVSGNYIILESGSALGKGVGPIIVSRSEGVDLTSDTISIAIPGKHTTANLLLSIFFPHIRNKTEYLFSDIEQIITEGKADAGLLIHEGRFTYQAKGLRLAADLGELWERRIPVPLPLGSICANRSLNKKEINDISDLIRESIDFAYSNPAAGRDYIKQHADEMDEDVIDKHIGLYVNEFSVALGDKGRNAIRFLLKEGFDQGLLLPAKEPVFNNDLI